MSETNVAQGEQSQDFKLEVVKGTLEIAPEEFKRLKSQLDLIRKIANQEKALVEAAKAIDVLDSRDRATNIPTHFYNPYWSDYGKYYILAPDTSSFPDFKARFTSLSADLGELSFGINPILLDSTLALASTTEAHPSDPTLMTGVALIFDYSKPQQEVEARVLTALRDHPAYDYGEELDGVLIEQIESYFPTPAQD